MSASMLVVGRPSSVSTGGTNSMSHVRTISTMRLLPSVPTAACKASASSGWPVSLSHCAASIALKSAELAVAAVVPGAVDALPATDVLDSPPGVDDVLASDDEVLASEDVLASDDDELSSTVDDVE